MAHDDSGKLGQQPIEDLSEWFTKAQAAAILKCPENLVEAIAKNGLIRSAERILPNASSAQSIIVYAPYDVSRICNEQPTVGDNVARNIPSGTTSKVANSARRVWFQKAQDAPHFLSFTISIVALVVSAMSWFESHANRNISELVNRPVLVVDKVELIDSSVYPNSFDLQVTFANNGKTEAQDVALSSLITYHCNPKNESGVILPVAELDKPLRAETGYFVGLQPNRTEPYSIPIQMVQAACKQSSHPDPSDDQYVQIESTVTYSAAVGRDKYATVWQAMVRDGKKRSVGDLSQANY